MRTITDDIGIERNIVDKPIPECCPGCKFKDPNTDKMPCCTFGGKLRANKEGVCYIRREQEQQP